MARPFDDDPDVLRSPQSVPTLPDGSGAARTLAMWSDTPRPGVQTSPYGTRLPDPPERPPHYLGPTIPNPLPSGSPLPRPSALPMGPPAWSPLAAAAYGNSVANALGRRTRWGLWVTVVVLAVVVGAAVALPFVPTVPAVLRPVRDAISGLTGLGSARAGTPVADGKGDQPPHRPRIVPLPADTAAPVASAPATPPVVRRGAVAAADPARPGLRGRGFRARVPLATTKGSLLDPFEDAASVARGDSVEGQPPRPQPAPVVAAREPPPAVSAPPPTPAPAPAARPARMVEPAAPKPPPGSLDDLMATAVGSSPPKPSKSELDKRLAGMDEKRDHADPPRHKEEAPPVHALTRSEIQAAMKAIQPRVGECARQFEASGSAELKVTVAEDGSVKTVSIGGVFAGTPTGGCVERAVKSAVFPASSGLRFDYPLAVR